jgi:hypothetical protein
MINGNGGATILCMPEDMKDKMGDFDVTIQKPFGEMKEIINWCLTDTTADWRTVDVVGNYWRLKSKTPREWVDQLARWDRGMDDCRMPDDMYLYATFRFTAAEDAAHFKLKYYDGTATNIPK